MNPYDYFRRRLNQYEMNKFRERNRYNVTDEIDFVYTTEELIKRFNEIDMIVHDDWSISGCIRDRIEK